MKNRNLLITALVGLPLVLGLVAGAFTVDFSLLFPAKPAGPLVPLEITASAAAREIGLELSQEEKDLIHRACDRHAEMLEDVALNLDAAPPAKWQEREEQVVAYKLVATTFDQITLACARRKTERRHLATDIARRIDDSMNRYLALRDRPGFKDRKVAKIVL
jgi:hypothetical protein